MSLTGSARNTAKALSWKKLGRRKIRGISRISFLRHAKGCHQHQYGGKQTHTCQGSAAHIRNMTDVNSVHHIIKQVDDLCHNRRNSHLYHQPSDAAGTHILPGFCLYRPHYLTSFHFNCILNYITSDKKTIFSLISRTYLLKQIQQSLLLFPFCNFLPYLFSFSPLFLPFFKYYLTKSNISAMIE